MTDSFRVFCLPRPSTLYARLHARLRPPDIPAQDVHEILEHYGLSLAGPPRNLPVGRRNRNLDLDTTGGRKLLKGYRPNWQAETVEYTHSILARLAETGFSASRLSLAPDGSTYVDLRGDYFTLFEFDEGMNYSGRFLVRAHRRKLMVLAGEMMARLHRQLKGFMPAGRHHMGFSNYTGPRWRDVEWHRRKLEEFKTRSIETKQPEPGSNMAWLVENSGRIGDEIARLDAVLSDADLPRLIVHGDYGLHNLLFRADGSVVIVDFELARIEWRLSDLVSCLSRFRYGELGDISYDYESIGWFLEGYQQVLPLSVDEWRFFPQVWAFYRYQSAVQYWNSYYATNGPERKLHSARDAVAQAEYALSHADELASLNAGASPARISGVRARSGA